MTREEQYPIDTAAFSSAGGGFGYAELEEQRAELRAVERLSKGPERLRINIV